jgi:hypothetical protein
MEVSAASTSTSSVNAGTNTGAVSTDAQASARAAVAQATNPATNQVDTGALSRQVAETAQRDPQAAAEMRAAIENELVAQSRVGDLSRFNQDLQAAANDGTFGTYGVPGMLAVGGQTAVNIGNTRIADGTALTARGTQALAANPQLTVRWESTTSAWTGNGGFTQPLRDVLDGHGIEVARQVNPVPAGSIGPNQGVSYYSANNTNGDLARDAIARRYSSAGYNVTTEVPVQNGARVVDIRADLPNADPRLAQRIEVESKAYRAGSSSFIRNEAANDGARLAENRAVRAAGLADEVAGGALTNSGRVLRTVGQVARPVGLALAGVEVYQSVQADGGRIGENTGRSVSGLAGGGLGAWGGAAAGAAIGSVVPGVGTVIGGIVGGIIGGVAGDAAGRGLFDTVKSWF